MTCSYFMIDYYERGKPFMFSLTKCECHIICIRARDAGDIDRSRVYVTWPSAGPATGMDILVIYGPRVT